MDFSKLIVLVVGVVSAAVGLYKAVVALIKFFKSGGTVRGLFAKIRSWWSK